MSLIIRSFVLVLITFTFIACGVAGEETTSCSIEVSSPAVVTNNATPQEAFDNARAAIEAEDWATFTAQLTPEAQDQMAGMMVMSVVMMKAMTEALGDMAQGMADGLAESMGEEAEEVDVEAEMEDSTAPLTALLEKYGLDEKAMEKNPQMMLGGNPGDGLAMLAGPIEDKPTFIAEAFEALSAADQEGSGPKMKGRLEDLEVQGDLATAKLVTDEMSEPIDFRKIDGSWRMSLPLPSGR